MTRMIERWFPCADVTANSKSGWGSGRSEKTLFPWFASRTLVQAKAAVICSLLPWPEESDEQERLCRLVTGAMDGRDSASGRLVDELARHYPSGASVLDSFSGRALIPLEAARLGVTAWGIDYSPVATLAGTLLADYPLRDWSDEPPLPFDSYDDSDPDHWGDSRLLRDVRFMLGLIGGRYEIAMDDFYPVVGGKRPWGYLWAITLPCMGCGRRFPLTRSLELRRANTKRNDPGQSYRIVASPHTGTFVAVVQDGRPNGAPTLATGGRNPAAVCVFCDHVHPFDVHTRLMGDGYAEDALLLVADHDNSVRRVYRAPTEAEYAAVQAAVNALAAESDFAPGLPAVPDEKTSGTTGPRSYAKYGYHSFGDCCNARQTLGFVRLARSVDDAAAELREAGVSSDYVAALCGYAGANLVRRIKRSTRGASLQIPEQAASHIFTNGPSVPFGFDYFETGCSRGPGTWHSLASQVVSALRAQIERPAGRPAIIQRGNAMAVPLSDGSADAVVIDPPYDAMVEYTDASGPPIRVAQTCLGAVSPMDRRHCTSRWPSGEDRRGRGEDDMAKERRPPDSRSLRQVHHPSIG